MCLRRCWCKGRGGGVDDLRCRYSGAGAQVRVYSCRCTAVGEYVAVYGLHLHLFTCKCNIM